MYIRDEEFNQAFQECCRLEKIRAIQESLNIDLETLEIQSEILKTQLIKETKDYDNLCKNSLSTILHTIIGDLHKKTEQERQEMIEAAIKHKQWLSNIQDIKNQIAQLELEKSNYPNSENDYHRLYEEKIQYLSEQNNNQHTEIIELSIDIEISKNNQIEIDEALKIGQELNTELSSVLDSLDSAEGWGVWDMLGGGLFVTLAKHSHIDKASAAANHTNSLLRQFKSELEDINISEEINVDLSSFEQFVDFFIDGFFMDWYIQSKIQTSKENVSDVKNKVDQIIQKLIDLSKAEFNLQEHLKEKIDQIIVNS